MFYRDNESDQELSGQELIIPVGNLAQHGLGEDLHRLIHSICEKLSSPRELSPGLPARARGRTSDIGHRTSDIGHRTSDIGHRTSDIDRLAEAGDVDGKPNHGPGSPFFSGSSGSIRWPPSGASDPRPLTTSFFRPPVSAPSRPCSPDSCPHGVSESMDRLQEGLSRVDSHDFPHRGDGRAFRAPVESGHHRGRHDDGASCCFSVYWPPRSQNGQELAITDPTLVNRGLSQFLHMVTHSICEKLRRVVRGLNHVAPPWASGHGNSLVRAGDTRPRPDARQVTRRPIFMTCPITDAE